MSSSVLLRVSGAASAPWCCVVIRDPSSNPTSSRPVRSAIAVSSASKADIVSAAWGSESIAASTPASASTPSSHDARCRRRESSNGTV
jgi:hypothetical protein